MKFEEVKKHVDGIPFIHPRNAEILYNFIVENKITKVLELGIAHGTASCYIAAALDEIGGGELVCVDLEEARNEFKPGIEELLQKTGLEKYVTVIREKTGYNWFLRNEIRKRSNEYNCTPYYDLCIIDGPKNWTIDGAAFFMADKLLKDNAWIIFDDYRWTYAESERGGASATDGVTHRNLSEEEINTPQIKEVFHLLVMQHPNYHNFKIHGVGDWAWAQKTLAGAASKQITIDYNVTYKDLFGRVFRMANSIFKFRKV